MKRGPYKEMMSVFYLQVVSTILCFACGIIAGLCLMTMGLDPLRQVLTNIVGVVCLPLGVMMAFSSCKERLELSRKGRII